MSLTAKRQCTHRLTPYPRRPSRSVPLFVVIDVSVSATTLRPRCADFTVHVIQLIWRSEILNGGPTQPPRCNQKVCGLVRCFQDHVSIIFNWYHFFWTSNLNKLHVFVCHIFDNAYSYTFNYTIFALVYIILIGFIQQNNFLTIYLSMIKLIKLTLLVSQNCMHMSYVCY